MNGIVTNQETMPMSLIGFEICGQCPFRLSGCFRVVVKSIVNGVERWYSIEARPYGFESDKDWQRSSCNVNMMRAKYTNYSKHDQGLERRYHPNLRQSFSNLSRDMGFKVTFDYPQEWLWRRNDSGHAIPDIHHPMADRQKSTVPVSFKKGGGCGSLNRHTRKGR